jgi:hypothetical protein
MPPGTVSPAVLAQHEIIASHPRARVFVMCRADTVPTGGYSMPAGSLILGDTEGRTPGSKGPRATVLGSRTSQSPQSPVVQRRVIGRSSLCGTAYRVRT